jgi:hypothetical protein
MLTFRVLYFNQFALILRGQAISQIGDRIFQITSAWGVLKKTGPAATMGSVFIYSLLPQPKGV